MTCLLDTGVSQAKKDCPAMIHFTCDCCKRRIDADDEFRYVVRMEVYAAIEPPSELGDADAERDHLEEIDELLERIDEVDCDELRDNVYQQVRYDLCSECREAFLQNPLGRVATNVGFSEN